MGRTAGAAAAREPANGCQPDRALADAARELLEGKRQRAGSSSSLSELRDQLGATMMEAAGIVREDGALRGGLRCVEELGEKLDAAQLGDSSPVFNQQCRRWLEARNLALLGGLVVRSALIRCESRGAHYRADFPTADAEAMHTLVRRQADGESSFDLEAARL
jgi:succinate dehydrogenase/fumarate reductase flavoprotein subunit